jgi:hypothetical protein
LESCRYPGCDFELTSSSELTLHLFSFVYPKGGNCVGVMVVSTAGMFVVMMSLVPVCVSVLGVPERKLQALRLQASRNKVIR